MPEVIDNRFPGSPLIAVKVENLSKKYRVGSFSGYRTLRETISDIFKISSRDNGPTASAAQKDKATDKYFWALKDINFAVETGSVVGIIGRNGAGKSTLLKILSKITEPTTGRVELRGRVGSLLEVGTGFHPELTGHENIYLYGAIMGMTRYDVSRKFDEIIAFAEIEKFLDTPVKRYSSGMYMRLAFAVAAHLEPEILLVDEVLAVGDMAFQKKCLGKMENVAQAEGRTVLFVSHNMAAIKSLCSKTLLLEQGRIDMFGDTAECIERYVTRCLAQASPNDVSKFRRGTITEDTPAIFRSVRVLKESGPDDKLPILSAGEDIAFEFDFKVSHPVKNATLTIVLMRTTGEIVSTIFSGDQGIGIELKEPAGRYRCCLKNIPLAPGTYMANIGLNQSAASQAYDVLEHLPLFTVSDVPETAGQFPNRPWGAFYWNDVVWEKRQ